MPRTPDRVYGPSLEEETRYDEQTEDPTEEGAVRYVSGAFKLKDSLGIYNPRTGGSGITEAEHKVLRQLIHFIDNGPAEGFVSGAYREILPSADPFPTSEIWWESSSKTKKIVELTITRNANKIPTAEEWKVYDTDGSTVLATVTDTISYTGIFETSRTRAIT